jgi:hypothetical protein
VATREPREKEVIVAEGEDGKDPLPPSLRVIYSFSSLSGKAGECFIDIYELELKDNDYAYVVTR